MKTFLSVLTAGLILLGFFLPILWVGALLTGFLAICSRPDGMRPDGKKRTGGLFGGVWDGMMVSSKMRDCPFCKMKIDKKVTKCQYCAKWITPLIQKGKVCSNCGQENAPDMSSCLICGNII